MKVGYKGNINSAYLDSTQLSSCTTVIKICRGAGGTRSTLDSVLKWFWCLYDRDLGSLMGNTTGKGQDYIAAIDALDRHQAEVMVTVSSAICCLCWTVSPWVAAQEDSGHPFLHGFPSDFMWSGTQGSSQFFMLPKTVARLTQALFDFCRFLSLLAFFCRSFYFFTRVKEMHHHLCRS